MTKFILYILVTILTTWAMDAVNINVIFKKGQVVKAASCLFFNSIIYYILSNKFYLWFWFI